jgi:hypothetical protein
LGEGLKVALEALNGNVPVFDLLFLLIDLPLQLLNYLERLTRGGWLAFFIFIDKVVVFVFIGEVLFGLDDWKPEGHYCFLYCYNFFIIV